jgi:hypothetical protein
VIRGRRGACCAVAAALLGVLTAGCGTGSPHGLGQAFVPVARPRDTGNQATAYRTARSLLDAFRPPPGAHGQAKPPAGASANLNHPPVTPRTADLVDVSTWWTAPGSAASVLAWERAHPPAGMSTAGGGYGGGMPAWVEFDANTPNQALNTNQALSTNQTLSTRSLLVQAVDLGQSRTAIRVDAQVVWLPTKPSGGLVPVNAAELTATLVSGLSGPGLTQTAPPKPATRTASTTNAAIIAAIARGVNQLAPAPAGVMHCPADFGGSLTLTFRRAVDGPVLATVRADTSGCADVTAVVNGHELPTLRGGADLARQVSALLPALR